MINTLCWRINRVSDEGSNIIKILKTYKEELDVEAMKNCWENLNRDKNCWRKLKNSIRFLEGKEKESLEQKKWGGNGILKVNVLKSGWLIIHNDVLGRHEVLAIMGPSV